VTYTVYFNIFGTFAYYIKTNTEKKPNVRGKARTKNGVHNYIHGGINIVI